jgi:hypothetical protein
MQDELSNVDERLKALEQEVAALRTQRSAIILSIKETELLRRKEAFDKYRKPLGALMDNILADDLLSFQCSICQDRYPRAYADLFEHECLRMCEYRFPCGHSICLHCAVRILKYDVDLSTLIGISQLIIRCPTCPTVFAMSMPEIEDSEADATVLSIDDPMHITCPGTPHLDEDDSDSSE